MKSFLLEVKWAIIFFLVSLLWMVLEKQLGWHDEFIGKHPVYSGLFGIFAIAIYVIALIDKKKNHYNGSITWTQAFLSGAIISIMITALSPLAQFITFEFITPDFFNNSIEYNVSRGRQTKEQASAYFNLKSYIIQSAFFGLSMGVITSAIVALVIRNKKTVS